MPRPYRFHYRTLLVAMRRAAYRRQGGLCYWCKEPMTTTADQTPKTCTADHLVPIYAGGQTVPGNIVAACRACNNSRNSPETNRSRRHDKRQFAASVGDDASASPFAVLRGLR